MTGSSYVWKVIYGEIPVIMIGNGVGMPLSCEVISEGIPIRMVYEGLGGLLWIMAEHLADGWCKVNQRDGKELAEMEEEEMHQEAGFLKLWVASEYPHAYDMINEEDIEDLYYEGIFKIAMENILEDGRPLPASELAYYTQDLCEIDLYEVSKNEGGDIAAIVFEEWVTEKHPQIYSRMLEYQTTQEKNIFEYIG
uniref:Uncharacterized protein n=1 Tax=Marseillevirus LCMAC101 TaxID=2506602 RepID=A0A481YS37_9VIRU|nr:MAG: hypothetical protein LCMAC101_01420 [Marseillevirus LCMAC101]